MNRKNISVVSCSFNKSYTGSFFKILALGNPGAVAGIPASGSILDDVSFGYMTDPLANAEITATVGDVLIPAGSYLDGPIVQFKVKNTTGGGILAYYYNDMPFEIN